MTLKKSLPFPFFKKNQKTSLKLFLILTFFLFLSVNYRIVKVSGESMRPTLHDGDLVIIDKHLYQFFPLKKTDLVVYKSLENLSIKRIKFLPGEAVPKIIFLDKEEGYEYRLRNDEYYVLGDNLEKSHDSRQIGPVRSSDIFGKVVVKF